MRLLQQVVASTPHSSRAVAEAIGLLHGDAIPIVAVATAGAAEYFSLRVVTDSADRVVTLFRANGFDAVIVPVLGVTVDDIAAAGTVAAGLAGAGIEIEYLYSTAAPGGRSLVVVKVPDAARALAALASA